jgi:hypothetical protein
MAFGADQGIASAPPHGANATSPWWGRTFVDVRYEFTMGLMCVRSSWDLEAVAL